MSHSSVKRKYKTGSSGALKAPDKKEGSMAEVFASESAGWTVKKWGFYPAVVETQHGDGSSVKACLLQAKGLDLGSPGPT